MWKSLLVLVALAFVVVAANAQYHTPLYLVGGYHNTTSTIFQKGIHILDASTPSPKWTRLCQPGYFASGFQMDWNNRDVLFCAQGITSTNTLFNGPKGGVFKVDPLTMTVSTHYAMNNTTAYHSFHSMVVNQDADYICAVNTYDRNNSQTNGYYIMKVDFRGVMTTLLTTRAIGRHGYWFFQIGTNIDTGHLLISDARSRTSPTTIRYPVLELDTETGKTTSWSTGGNYGWYGVYSVPQDHRDGYIKGPDGGYVYQLKPGTTGRTTLATLVGLPDLIHGSGKYDLQTAAQPRQVFLSFAHSPNSTWLYYLDAKTWTVTTFQASSSLRVYNYGFGFYKGRHTQTAKSGHRQWVLLLSAPQYPGSSYMVMASYSGVRPGIRLPDGRHINLNPDPLTHLTASNLLPGIWNPGPGVLDANGEARGQINLSAVPKLGIPIWIVWAVLDPKAPNGIAYLPDTYVMRI